MPHTTFKVTGMHCASCVARNEEALKKIPGVSDAVVNFATGLAKVTHAEGVSAHHLHHAVESEGYGVSMGHDHMHDSGDVRTAGWRAFGALVLGGLGRSH